MDSQELTAILRLQATKGVGDIIAKKLIEKVGSAAGVFKEKPTKLASINGIGQHIISQLQNTAFEDKAVSEFEKIKKHKQELLYYKAPDYPKRLQQCSDGPILLFKDGRFDLNKKRVISIVGTRNISNYGKTFIKNLVAELSNYQPIIISGFAYGCDIEAHKQALENNLQTVAVLAHGFNEVYPKAHKKYISSLHQNGGFLTEFWQEEKPLRENFLKRNRIVAGLAEATIVIESASKGGSLVTADIANSYNREVFALPGRSNDIYSQGCNNLIKSHKANLLTSAQDIVEMLNWDISKKESNIQKSLFVSMTEKEQQVFDYLQQNGKQLLDIIAIDCSIPVYELSSLLLTMELKGIIKPLPGKLFEV